VVTLVHRFARAIEHSPGVRDALNTRGLVDANCIAALLAN
jgi:hypothetical protein